LLLIEWERLDWDPTGQADDPEADNPQAAELRVFFSDDWIWI